MNSEYDDIKKDTKSDEKIEKGYVDPNQYKHKDDNYGPTKLIKDKEAIGEMGYVDPNIYQQDHKKQDENDEE